MVYDPWEMLRVLVQGGWLTVSQQAGREEVRLWQFLDGWEYEHLVVPSKNFRELVAYGLVEFWRFGEDRDGRPAGIFLMARRETWPLI